MPVARDVLASLHASLSARARARARAHPLKSLVGNDVDAHAYVGECIGVGASEVEAREAASKQAAKVLHSMRLLNLLGSDTPPLAAALATSGDVVVEATERINNDECVL